MYKLHFSIWLEIMFSSESESYNGDEDFTSLFTP